MKILTISIAIILTIFHLNPERSNLASRYYPYAKGQFDILVKKYGPINICIFGIKGERATALKTIRLQF